MSMLESIHIGQQRPCYTCLRLVCLFRLGRTPLMMALKKVMASLSKRSEKVHEMLDQLPTDSRGRPSLVVTRCIASSNKKLLVAPGLATRSDRTLLGPSLVGWRPCPHMCHVCRRREMWLSSSGSWRHFTNHFDSTTCSFQEPLAAFLFLAVRPGAPSGDALAPDNSSTVFDLVFHTTYLDNMNLLPNKNSSGHRAALYPVSGCRVVSFFSAFSSRPSLVEPGTWHLDRCELGTDAKLRSNTNGFGG